MLALLEQEVELEVEVLELINLFFSEIYPAYCLYSFIKISKNYMYLSDSFKCAPEIEKVQVLRGALPAAP